MASVNQKVNPEEIHLMSVRIVKSHFEVSEVYQNEEIERFSMGFKSDAGFDFDAEKVKFNIYIKIKGLDQNDSYVGICGEYQLEFLFEVENLGSFVDRKEGAEPNDFSVSQVLGATLAGISYSTSRGIILDRTQSTDFNGVLLPVINPSTLLLEDSYSKL